MISFINYFSCGKIIKYREAIDFDVTKFSDIVNQIIPFLKKYPIVGTKSKDFEDWCHIAELMKNKQHLTKEGFEEIKKIKSGMRLSKFLE